MNADINAILLRWQIAERNLRTAITEELEARAAVVSIAFPEPVEGTNNRPLGNGYVLKGVFKKNYTLDSARVEEQFKLLPRAVGANLLKWGADIKVREYKALEPAHKIIVNEVLTIKDGRPAIEIVAPKER